jgi:molybdopterin-guanine dinucleotide biosynthesis protein A
MGRDKARIRVAGRSLLAWSTDAARLLGLPIRVIRRDDVPRCGPLGGVATALHRSNAGILLFLSCDMPIVTPALLQRVLARLTPRTRAAFTQAGQHLGFPFALRLSTRSTVDALIARGQCSLRQLAEALEARNIPIPKRDLPLLANLNTPDSLDALRPTLLAQAATRRPRP